MNIYVLIGLIKLEDAVMNLAEFFLQTKRLAGAVSASRDPLGDARRFLELHGETSEGQALSKVLTALMTIEGEFSEAEIWRFRRETLGLVAALIQARIDGLYPELDWWR